MIARKIIFIFFISIIWLSSCSEEGFNIYLDDNEKEEEKYIPGNTAYFPLNGDTNDYSTNENHGTISGSVTSSTDRYNIDNSAYYIDGEDARISIPYSADYEVDGTIAFWFKTGGSWPAASVTDAPVLFNCVNTGYGGFNIMIDNNDNGGAITLQLKDASGTMVFNQTGVADVTDNSWHFIVLTYTFSSGGEINLYFDGDISAPEINGTTSGEWSFNGHELVLGDMFGTWWAQWKGWVDELRIYNRFLNDEEIDYLYSY